MPQENKHPQKGVLDPQQAIQPPVSSDQNLIKLLEFDEKFLGAIHSSVYNHKQISDDVTVQFQVTYIADLNELWAKMINQLTQLLVKQKLPYENTVKQYFHKLFHMSYLPLLRINKHELTQLSLFGFDIYIPPLTAILEIINRIDGLKYTIEKCLTNQDQGVEAVEFIYNQPDIWEQMKKGWNNFLYYSSLWKIRLNIYLLKEYLKIGAQSLVKKDKEIVFTGCNNIFGGLVPILKQRQEIWLLVDCAELANQLYSFSPSYNYSYLFTLMFPLKIEYYDIFTKIQKIAEKCMNAYILTPMLFAILRNYEAFLRFIEEADNIRWAQFLDVLAYGLLINFKARILEYQEVLVLFKKIVLKLGVMSRLKVHMYLRGQLQKQWGEARQFFISALKIGYNFGDLQTWHLIPQQKIQSEILNCCRDAILMHDQLPEQYNAYIPQEGYKLLMDAQVQEITNSKLSFDHFASSFSQKILEDITKSNISPQKLAQIIFRLKNLIQLSNMSTNPYILSSLFLILSQIQFNEADKFNHLYIDRLQKTSLSLLNQTHSLIIEGNNDLHCLQNVLFTKKIMFPLKSQKTLYLLIQIYLCLGNPKQALHQIFKTLQSLEQKNESIPDKLSLWIAANIIGLYNPHEDHHQNQQNLVSLKTFNKQYKLPKKAINFQHKMHSCVSFLIDKAIFKKSDIALQIMVALCSIQKWLVIPLMSFPVNFTYETEEQERDSLKRSMIIEDIQNSDKASINKNKLQAFSLWFIKSGNRYHHQTLKQLISLNLNNLSSEFPQTSTNIYEYMEQVFNTSIYEQIVIQINNKFTKIAQTSDKQLFNETMDLLVLLSELISIKTHKNEQQIGVSFYKKMIKLYLRIFDGLQSRIMTNRTTQSTKQISAYNQKIVEKLRQSIFKIYIPTLSMIYRLENNSTEQAKLWVRYMKKVCSISMVPPIEGIEKNIYSYHKDYQLPSIKKDNAFLIQNSMDYMKQNKIQKPNNQVKMVETLKPIQKYYEQLQESSKNHIPPSFVKTDLLPNKDQIKQLTMDQISEKQLTKEFLVPSLSDDSIAQIMEYVTAHSDLNLDFIQLLALTPANHHKIFLWCLSNLEQQPTNRGLVMNILGEIGLTKQIVNYDGTNLCRLLAIKPQNQQIQATTSSLDGNAKKILSDSFIISTIMKKNSQKELQFIQSLLKTSALYFLLVYNQSNWRNLIDWLCKNMNASDSRNKGPALSNNYSSFVGSTIPSIILQYLEYIRITKKPNKQYENKIKNYGELISVYSKLFTLKRQYLADLQLQCKKRQQQSFVSQSQNGKSSQISEFSEYDKNSSISEVSRRTKTTLIVETFISQQEIDLYNANELANVRMVMDYGQCRDVLKRVTLYQKQIQKIFGGIPEKMGEFQQIDQIFKELIIKPLILINSITNEIAKGPEMLPDFLRTYCLCTQNAYHKHNIEIGQYLQDYFIETEQPIDESLFYKMKPLQTITMGDILCHYCVNLSKMPAFPEGYQVSIECSGEQKKKIHQSYNWIRQRLIADKIIKIEGKMIEILGVGQEGQQNQSIIQSQQMIPYLGLFMAHSQNNQPIQLIEMLINRQKIPYQQIKAYHPENYHYIKSILIDEEESLAAKQINFTLKGVELIEGGKQVKVNGSNKAEYCNYVGLKSLDDQRIVRIKQFIKGYNALCLHH